MPRRQRRVAISRIPEKGRIMRYRVHGTCRICGPPESFAVLSSSFILSQGFLSGINSNGTGAGQRPVL
jgi:hypothetical protein